MLIGLVVSVASADPPTSPIYPWQTAEVWSIETGGGPRVELMRWNGNCYLLIGGFGRAGGSREPVVCPHHDTMPPEPYDPYTPVPGWQQGVYTLDVDQHEQH